MGRGSKNKQLKCEDFNLNVAEPEPQQEELEPVPEQEDAEPEPELENLEPEDPEPEDPEPEPEDPEPEPEDPEPEPEDPEPEQDPVPQQDDQEIVSDPVAQVDPEPDPVSQQADTEPEPVPQQAEPDPEPHQGDEILQDLQAPEPQQIDEISADLQVDPIPDPSHEDEIQQDPQVDPVSIEDYEDETVTGDLNIQAEAQQEVLPVEPEEEDQEGVLPVSQESSEQEGETETEDPPTLQESSEQGVEHKTGDSPVLKESSEREAGQVGIAPTSQKCPESEVEAQVGVPPVSQESAELEVGTRIEVSPDLQGCPEQLKIDSAEIQDGDDNSVLRINLKQEMEANVQQEQERLCDETIAPGREVPSNIVPMISDILQPIFEEAGSEILQQMPQRQNIHVVPMVSSFLPQIFEAARNDILEQTNQNMEPVPSELLTSSEEAGSEIAQQMHQIIVPTTATLRPWREILQQMRRILPIGFEFLQPSREEFRTEILFPTLFLTFEQRRFIVSNLIDATVIIHRELTTYHSIRILQLSFSTHFRTMPRLLPAEPLIPLSALVESAPLSPLRELRHLLGLADIRDLPALEYPDLPVIEPTQRLSCLGHFSLSSIPESPPLCSSSEPRPNLSEAEMCSRLQKRKDVDQELSEFSSVHHSEAAEALAVYPRKPMKARAKKRRKRSESSKPGYADTTFHPYEYQEMTEFENHQIEDPGEQEFSDPTELQNLLEIENEDIAAPGEPDIPDPGEPDIPDPGEPDIADPGEPDIADPGEPDILDPTDIFKDLDFQEMKGDSKETERTESFELEPVKGSETEAENDLKTEASESLETEVTEDDGDINTEASEDLETEVTEDGGDLNTEASEESKTKAKGDLETNDDEDLETSDDKDLEMSYEDLESDDGEGLETDNDVDVGVEECQLLLPHEEQLPHEDIIDPHEDIIEIPDDAEDNASSGGSPSDEGNSVCICPETHREGEATLEELLEEAVNPCRMKYLVLGVCICIAVIVAVSRLIYHGLTDDGSGSNTTNPVFPELSLKPGNFYKKHH